MGLSCPCALRRPDLGRRERHGAGQGLGGVESLSITFMALDLGQWAGLSRVRAELHVQAAGGYDFIAAGRVRACSWRVAHEGLVPRSYLRRSAQDRWAAACRVQPDRTESFGFGDRMRGSIRLRGCKGLGTKGDVMGQRSIGQWPERREVDPRGSVTVDCVDVVHRARICRAQVCHQEKTGRAQLCRSESQDVQHDDAHPLNPVGAQQAQEER